MEITRRRNQKTTCRAYERLKSFQFEAGVQSISRWPLSIHGRATTALRTESLGEKTFICTAKNEKLLSFHWTENFPPFSSKAKLRPEFRLKFLKLLCGQISHLRHTGDLQDASKSSGFFALMGQN